MSRYVALLDGGRREEAVEVKQVGPGVYEVAVGGRVRTVDAFRQDSGTVSLLVDTASWSVQLDPAGAAVKVRIDDSLFELEILDERRLRMRRATAFAAQGRQSVTAPMAGRVVKVLRRAGDEVRAGQAILVVEAMKMENEIRSPKDGKVTEVYVREGEAVEGGAQLAAIE